MIINGIWRAESNYSEYPHGNWCDCDYLADAILKAGYVSKASIEDVVLNVFDSFDEHSSSNSKSYEDFLPGWLEFIKDNGGFAAFDTPRAPQESIISNTKAPQTSWNSTIMYQPNPNVPRCPTCQSTNIEKVKLAKKLLSIELLGLASNKIGKQFKCKNCGYYW